MKILNKTGWFFLALLAFASCSEESYVENPSGETFIYNLQIINGDLSGGGRYTGVVDEAAKTVTFDNVAAESDVSNVKLSGKLSLGAHLDAEAYDFLAGNDPEATTLTKTVQVINVKNTQEYTVTLNLAAPQATPIVSKLDVTTAAGTVVAASIDLDEKVVYLNVPNEDEVTLTNVVLIPARTEYTFSDLTDGKLSKSNPGTLSLDFLGLTDEYTVSFEKAPAAGINFSAPVIHDFTVNSTIYPSFTAEITRSSDFDGEWVLIVDRNEPKVLRAADILANNVVNATPLIADHLAVASDETFAISSGQLSHGHIYICNLAQSGQKLRVYYYDTPTSAPQKVLEWTNTITRFGDNITVNVDENGNGYAYFVRQDPGDKIARFEITNFTAFSEEPVIIDPSINVSYYANYNQVGSANSYLLTSSTTAMIQLLDKDGGLQTEVEIVPNSGGADAKKGTDAHIAEYNKGRYLIMTSGKRFAYDPSSALFIYDITEGFDLVSSLVAFGASHPEPVYTYTMEALLSTAPAGNTAWAVVDGKLVVFTAAPHCGFALIEFPRNQQ
ncbi:MAG: DUF4623 domain-containing protein [Prevotella sp.]|jgi:hypothetical protein|nr:DUF4623 domain-containing protein [Prevotella sp.]